MGVLIDHSGLRVGRLTVVSYAGARISGGRRRGFWKCQCDCGNSIDVVTSNLTSGHSKSCGCAGAATHFGNGRPGERGLDSEVRFWMGVRSSRESCWEWTRARNGINGYGLFEVGGESFVASRYSWQLHFGEIPAGLFVCHKCDNPPCVRPDHLFLGTPLDNIRDMFAKGRNRAGGGTYCKLTPANVADVRQRLSIGERRKDVAESLGVTRWCIDKIAQGKTWQSV